MDTNKVYKHREPWTWPPTDGEKLGMRKSNEREDRIVMIVMTIGFIVGFILLVTGPIVHSPRLFMGGGVALGIAVLALCYLGGKYNPLI